MARNVEIKARILDFETLRCHVAALTNAAPTEISQDDTFFRCDAGRLKLRAFSAGEGELIFYRRTDTTGPSESFYLRADTSTPALLRDCLTMAYGQAGRVRKQRWLYLLGRTRIHLDRVEGLGDFLELEVVLNDHESTEVGVAEAKALMGKLNVDPEQLIDVAYVDLLRSQATRSSTHGSPKASEQ